MDIEVIVYTVHKKLQYRQNSVVSIENGFLAIVFTFKVGKIGIVGFELHIPRSTLVLGWRVGKLMEGMIADITNIRSLCKGSLATYPL